MSRARRIGVLCACAVIAIAVWLLARGSFTPEGEQDGAASGGPGAPVSVAPVAPALAGLRAGERVDADRKAAATAAARRTIHVRGEVIAPAGETLPEGVVVVRVPGESGPSSDPVPWSANGTFHVAWTPAVDEIPAVVEVRAAALGWSLTSGRFEVKEGEAEHAHVFLHGDGEFDGKIVDEEGRSLAGVLLAAGAFANWRSPTTWPDLVASAGDSGGDEREDPRGWALTDAYGRFRIRGMTKGARLEAIGGEQVWCLRSEPLGEEGDAATTWVAVPGFRYRAHVHLADGGPRPTFGLAFRVHDAQDDWITSSSGGPGERGWYQRVFPRTRLPSGRFQVEARLLSNECEPWNAEVSAEAKDGLVTFDVPVRRLDPSSLGRVSVALPHYDLETRGFDVARRMSPGGEWWVLRTVYSGNGDLWELPTGVQELRVSVRTVIGEPLAWTEKVSVVSDKVTTLRPVFTFGSLRVRASRGAEAAAATTMTIHDGKRAATFSLSGPDLVVPALAVGTYSLHLSPTRGRGEDREAVVQSQQETVVDFGVLR